MPEIVVLCGPPASGKSSYAAKHFAPTEIVSTDTVYHMVSDGMPGCDWLMRQTVDHLVEQRLRAGRRICVDGLNMDAHRRRRFVEMARAYDAPAYLVVLQPSLADVLARNERRFIEGNHPSPAEPGFVTRLHAALGDVRREAFHEGWDSIAFVLS